MLGGGGNDLSCNARKGETFNGGRILSGCTVQSTCVLVCLLASKARLSSLLTIELELLPVINLHVSIVKQVPINTI